MYDDSFVFFIPPLRHRFIVVVVIPLFRRLVWSYSLIINNFLFIIRRFFLRYNNEEEKGFSFPTHHQTFFQVNTTDPNGLHNNKIKKGELRTS